MTATQTARHLAPARTIDIREVAHQNHGYVDWCLRCLNETKAGMMPTNVKELGFKGRSWTAR